MSFRTAVDLRDYTSRGLTNAVTVAVQAGRLSAGERLPPIRTIARDLELSPTTVSASWAVLARRGVLRTDGRRGTTVAAGGTPGPTRYRRALHARSEFAVDVSTGVPDPQLLPSLDPALRAAPHTTGRDSYLDDPVLPRLREALRSSWPYDAGQLTIADGSMDAMDLISTVHLEPGDSVAVEHPGFPPLLDLLDAHGMRLVGMAMDDHGPTVDAVQAAVDRGVSAVFVQPRAHNPTGICLTPERAAQLAAVLRDGATLVVEDDSAGEIASTPAISLGQWIPDQVLHIRSFSKSHGPDLRLAAVSGSTVRIAALVERRLLGQGWTSRLLQSVLVELLRDDRAAVQVAHARQEYAKRRTAVVDGLRQSGVPVTGTDGLNIWLPVQDESAALVHLAGRGVAAAAGSPFHVLADDEAHLRITTGLIRGDPGDLVIDLVDAARATSWVGPR